MTGADLIISVLTQVIDMLTFLITELKKTPAPTKPPRSDKPPFPFEVA